VCSQWSGNEPWTHHGYPQAVSSSHWPAPTFRRGQATWNHYARTKTRPAQSQRTYEGDGVLCRHLARTSRSLFSSPGFLYQYSVIHGSLLPSSGDLSVAPRLSSIIHVRLQELTGVDHSATSTEPRVLGDQARRLLRDAPQRAHNKHHGKITRRIGR
jgi:hypothetical protein